MEKSIRDEPENEGYRCAIDGGSLDFDNPYEAREVKSFQWRSGFRRGLGVKENPDLADEPVDPAIGAAKLAAARARAISKDGLAGSIQADGYEIGRAIALWSRHSVSYRERSPAPLGTYQRIESLGFPERKSDEDSEEFGIRFAKGLISYLMES